MSSTENNNCCFLKYGILKAYLQGGRVTLAGGLTLARGQKIDQDIRV